MRECTFVARFSEVRTPTSRNNREKWGTPTLASLSGRSTTPSGENRTGWGPRTRAFVLTLSCYGLTELLIMSAKSSGR